MHTTKTILLGIAINLFLKADAQNCNLNPPVNLLLTDLSPCSAVLHWSPVPGAARYIVRYQQGTAISIQHKVTDTFYTFTGLQDGSPYDFQVKSICSDGTKSKFVKKTASLPECELPFQISANASSHSATITFTTHCSFDSAYCRYGLSSSSLNSQQSSAGNSISISDLLLDSTYFYQVNVCNLNSSSWSAIDSFKTVAPKPNIIFILLDDAQYDLFSCNGAASFHQTPHIDRIANEGVNFKNAFVPHALCAPSRATIATGDYTVRHRVVDNQAQDTMNHDLPILPALLHDAGYYTAFIGKNHDIFKYGDGDFDYWLSSSGDDDTLANFTYFTHRKTVAAFETNVLSDSAVSVIKKAQSPFFLWLAYLAPHTPLIPSAKYRGLYDNLTMPLGADTARYTMNYPSCLYNLPKAYLPNSQERSSLFYLTYEIVRSVDDGVGKILHTLDSLGITDNTMIIFTSDNGHLLGEHGVNTKRFAYEQSMRIPLFIRYPEWFPDSSFVTDQLALNIDLAPTMLEVAGIPDTFNMDGTSLHKLFSGQASRNEFYYHYWYSIEKNWKRLPDIQAVRDFSFKYIRYSCGQVTEELFDMVNDPREMNNLANNSAYSGILNNYRMTLDNHEEEFGDGQFISPLNCNLVSPVFSRLADVENDFVMIYPNPAGDFINAEIENTALPVSFKLFDVTGKMRFTHLFENTGTYMLNIQDLSNGIYWYQIETPGSVVQTEKLIVQRP